MATSTADSTSRNPRLSKCLSAICAKSWRGRPGANHLWRPFGVEAIDSPIQQKYRRYAIPEGAASAAACSTAQRAAADQAFEDASTGELSAWDLLLSFTGLIVGAPQSLLECA